MPSRQYVAYFRQHPDCYTAYVHRMTTARFSRSVLTPDIHHPPKMQDLHTGLFIHGVVASDCDRVCKAGGFDSTEQIWNDDEQTRRAHGRVYSIHSRTEAEYRASDGLWALAGCRPILCSVGRQGIDTGPAVPIRLRCSRRLCLLRCRGGVLHRSASRLDAGLGTAHSGHARPVGALVHVCGW